MTKLLSTTAFIGALALGTMPAIASGPYVVANVEIMGVCYWFETTTGGWYWIDSNDNSFIGAWQLIKSSYDYTIWGLAVAPIYFDLGAGAPVGACNSGQYAGNVRTNVQ